VYGVTTLTFCPKDDAYLAATTQHMFDAELIRHIGMFTNEYLYYFCYAERAVESIQSDELTRGEEVLQLNRRLLDRLRTIDIARNPDDALRAYLSYERRRSSTYMHYANPDGLSMEEADQAASEQAIEISTEGGEGYAGVALKIIQALQTGEPTHTALNVPNGGALDFMRPDDVVEISCDIENGEIHPLPVKDVPEEQQLLMRNIKLYERRAVEATLNRSRQQAIYALMAHPLVLSYSLAQTLVNEYLEAHADYIGEWN
jgi:6-phospho-beta-glucosidase